MSHRLRAALLALLLVTLSSPAAAAVGPDYGAANQQTTATPTEQAPVEQTTIRIQLKSNGDARWIITTRFNVSTQRERNSFNETAEAFVDGETDALGLSAFRQASTAASRSTGRQMNVTNVERSSNHTEHSLTLSFTWTNFARVEDEIFYVDDVYETEDGTWFDGLGDGQVLVVELPPEAGVRSAPKRVQNGMIVWEGPQEFAGSDLHLAYSQQEPVTTTTTPGTPTESKTTNQSGPGPGQSPRGGENNAILWGGFFAIGLGIAVVSVYMLSRRDADAFGGEAPPQGGPDAGRPPAGASQSPEQESTPEDDSGDEINEELLSDEERVERLLEQNGGRMKQANIVKETGWSNAKVSQLLSVMEEDGQIDKLRIGRENLISFPDEDVTDIKD